MFGKKILLLFLGILFLVLFSFYFFPHFKVGIPFLKVSTPPDLSNCDRLILQFQKSHYEYFTRLIVRESLLNTEEKEYLKSLKNIEVTDKERIKAFANIVSSGELKQSFNTADYLFRIQVDCYKGEKNLFNFCVSKDSIFTPNPNLHEFEYSSDFDESFNYIADVLLPPLLWSLKARGECATNMSFIFNHIENQKETISYPDSKQWSDTVLSGLRNKYTIWEDMQKHFYSENEIFQSLTCPSVYGHIFGYSDFSQGIYDPNSLKNSPVSNYAINPNCMPDSPDDMVLLFESKTGWNQYGGPEIFTFDNHDPKGGCVLFNDGTVKFIRTEEELNNLHWK